MLEPARSFERFAVGGGNELAFAAARRVAESPGYVYNPLVISGPSGSGKTHLLHAIGQLASGLDPDLTLRLESAEALADRVTRGIADGELTSLRSAISGLEILMIDDLDHVAGMERTQQEIAGIVRRMIGEARQVVITTELSVGGLDGLIPELRDLLGGGVAVDIGPLDLEGRRTLLERLARYREIPLRPEVAEVLASFEIHDIRRLQEVVEQLSAIALAENRFPTAEDVYRVLGHAPREVEEDEFESFLHDITRTLSMTVETAPWRRRIGEAILRWEGEGIVTRRLEEALHTDTAPDVDTLLDRFERDAARLLQVRRELGIGDGSDELRDPDDLESAEALLVVPEPAAPGDEDAVTREAAVDPWFLNRDRVVLDWLDLEARLVEESR
jgi:hypothetical protein